MNIDKELVARAMDKAGEEPITAAEWEDGTGTRVRLIKDLYLVTIQEALAGTDWTSQKTRVRLELAENSNLSTYRYKYLLPENCAKPCALVSDDEYLVEGKYLYTDTSDAVLIYVDSGYTGQNKYEQAVPQPEDQEDMEGLELYKIDDDGNYVRVDTWEDTIFYVIVKEDFPKWKDFQFDPLLNEYIETVLAQKIVLKLTGDVNKYQLLYSEARLMEQRAISASVAHGHNKDKGNPYWADVIGLPNYGGN